MTNLQVESLWWRLVRFGFRLLYNEFAWTYDLVSWTVSLGHWHKWQQAAIQHLLTGPKHRVLELAHGTANLQIDLARAGIYAFGLDISASMGRIARRKLARNDLEAQLVRGSAMKLPFARTCFTSVVSTFPTEFIVHEETLQEVHRVLESGGRLVVVPNGMLELANPIARFMEWLYQITGQRGPWPSDPLVAFKNAGFEARLLIEKVNGSQAWIIIADKP